MGAWPDICNMGTCYTITVENVLGESYELGVGAIATIRL